MPVVLRFRGYRFLIFSNEGDPREPRHIHVRKGEQIAKFWLEPEIALAESYRLNSSELRRLRDVVVENRELFVRAWNEHFGE